MISDRLHAITEEVYNNNIVCDIGTDHGLLPIFLIKSKKANKVFAVDVNEKPLEQAQKNIFKYKIDKKNIELILSSGLKWVKDEHKIDTCIISGLGGTSIVDILSDDNKNISKYLLCPNNNEKSIRIWAKNNKYFIEKEKIIKEKDFFYTIIIINKKNGLKVKNKKDIILGPFFRRNMNSIYLDYLKSQLQKIDSYFFKLSRKSKNFNTLKKRRKIIKKEIDKKGEYSEK